MTDWALFLRHHRIISAFGFALAVDGEVGDALEITNDACEIVHILTLAVRTFGEISLVDVSAVVAQRVGDVEGEIVATLLCGYAKEMAILCLRQMLLEVAVERTSARKMVDVATTVESEFLDGVDVFVFHHIEITVVAITRHVVAIGFVPTCVFHSHVFSRNHFAVEEEVFRAILLVVVFDEREDAFHKVGIFLVVADGDAQTFCSFYDAVHPDGEILALDVDVASIEEGEQSALTHPVEVGIVGHLYFVHKVDDAIEIFHVVATFARGLLHAAVDVDGEHRLRTSAHTTCTEGVGEAVVLDFIT